MSVKRRKLPDDSRTRHYYYEFMVDGKRFRGSTGCTTEREAAKFEKNLIDQLRTEKSARTLVVKYGNYLTGEKVIPLETSFGVFLTKPRRRPMTERAIGVKQSYWDDFCAFLEDRHPTVKALNEVTPAMAEEYIQQIRTHGKYRRDVKFRRKGRGREIEYVRKQEDGKALSNRTCNDYHDVLREIFSILPDDSPLTKNPFRNIPRLSRDTQGREAFTPAELSMIGRKADGFCHPLFAIAINTALREGDICTLRWSEIDLEGGWITRTMRKTGKPVRIPILPPLRGYLLDLKDKAQGSEFVLPQHAEVYRTNPTGVSYRVGKFLDGLETDDGKIETTRTVAGRARRVSVKDLHSCRHTFCYLAAVYGVPFPIVKSIAGHVNPQITQMYMDHADDDMKRQKLAGVPNFLGLPEPEDSMPSEGETVDQRKCPTCSGVIAQLHDMNETNWQQLRDAILSAYEEDNGRREGT